MSEVHRVSVEVGGSEITFETGRLAKQASGSVVVSAGETMVLGTATAGNPRDVDFLPLTVDVEERMYAAGKIPRSFFKREGRAGRAGPRLVSAARGPPGRAARPAGATAAPPPGPPQPAAGPPPRSARSPPRAAPPRRIPCPSRWGSRMGRSARARLSTAPR